MFVTSWLVLGFVSPVFAAGSNIVALYAKGSTGANNELKLHGCATVQQGQIFGQQGSMKIEGASAYSVFHCEKGVDFFKSAPDAFSNVLAAFSGTVIADRIHREQKGQAKQIIFKLSRFNNLDVDKRNQEQQGINRSASTRTGHWKDEYYLNVDDTLKMEAVDEVVMISYSSAEVADRFRNQNQDILTMVGEFNRAHLTEFVYLVGNAQ
ncbi:MAG: hypothetical protein MI743_05525 [Sneathiellales bacterium]|nr:hypothetical protein [Sneathiellales bacterium]